MKKMILAIDQGTTGSTALLIDLKGKVLGAQNEPFKQIFPKIGWVEHDPEEILKSVKLAIKKVFLKSNKKPEDVLTVGVTNQRETVVFWNAKTGKPYGNALVWQCRRTSKRTEEIKNQGDESWIRKKTGLGVDPYFSSTKIEWFLNKYKNKKNLQIGTIDSFLIWHLTKGKSFVTEPSNASRTQLFNIRTQKWDDDLLKYFGVSKDSLPEVRDSNANFGFVENFSSLKNGTPITGVLGDQQSSLFGHGAFSEGEVKCTFGTGSFILLNTGEKLRPSKSGGLTTIGWRLKGENATYALEGGAFNCASCINWFKDQTSVISKSSEIGPLSEKVKDSYGVKFAPTFSGVGAPYWSPESTGAFIGLTRGTEKAHLAKALLEGLSFQNGLIFKALEKDYKSEIKKVYVDGGVSQSNEFMKIQAAFSGKKLVRPKNIETTALGAAFMAGLGLGTFKNKNQIKKLNSIERSFSKKLSVKEKALVSEYDVFFKALRKPPFLKS